MENKLPTNSIVSDIQPKAQIDESFTNISTANTQQAEPGNKIITQQTPAQPILEKKSTSRKKIAVLAIFLVLTVLIIGSARGYYILVTKKYPTQSLNNITTIDKATLDPNLNFDRGLMIPLSPYKIGLTLKKGNDNKTAIFSIASLSGYSSAQFEIIYTSDGKNQKEAKGKLDPSKNPISKMVTLESCENQCSIMEILVEATDAKGSVYAIATTPQADSPNTPAKIDDAKLVAISQFKYDIEMYYDEKQTLPQNLSSLYPANFNLPYTKTTDFQYKIKSQTTYEICTIFSTDNQKEVYPKSDYRNLDKHSKGNQCFSYEIPTVYVRYLQKPTNLDPNYQPMILSGGFDLAISKRGDHVLQAKVIGKNCTSIDGKNGNNITVYFDPSLSNLYSKTDRYVYHDWQIWDTGCGFDTGNPISFTLDGKPVGISYSRYDPETKNHYDYTCLPFIANKKMTGDGGYTGSFVEIATGDNGYSAIPNLDCSNVILSPAFPGTPTPTPTPSSDSRDKQRLMDLLNFQSILNYYKHLNGSYPRYLNQAVALNSTYKMWMDPLTNQQYPYTVNSNGSDYQLCAPSFEKVQQKCVNSTVNPYALK